MSSEYIGFDSRVVATLFARIPPTEEVVVDFAVTSSLAPVVLFASRLLVYDETPPREFSLQAPAVGLSIDDRDVIRIQFRNSVSRIMGNQLVADSSFAPKGRWFDAGNTTLLDVFDSDGIQKMVLRRSDSSSSGLAGAQGSLHAAFWGEQGMAAAIGNSVYTWAIGSREFSRLVIDKGISNTLSICLAGASQVIVDLPRAVVVVTKDNQIVLAGMSALCTFRKKRLFLLDVVAGGVWVVDGVEKIGEIMKDRDHAVELIRNLPLRDPEQAPEFLEAARYIGCSKAQELLRQRQTK